MIDPQTTSFCLLLVLLGGAQAMLDDKQKTRIVDLHNMYRSAIRPSAASMRLMQWSDRLEDEAIEYAMSCPTSYDTTATAENIAVASPRIDVERLMKIWFVKEGAAFNLDSGFCEPGKDCDHFRFAITDQASKVGCSSSACAVLPAPLNGPGEVIVCRYDRAPSAPSPYVRGPACSACPPGHACRCSLCVPIAARHSVMDKCPDGTNWLTTAVTHVVNKPLAIDVPATPVPAFKRVHLKLSPLLSRPLPLLRNSHNMTNVPRVPTSRSGNNTQLNNDTNISNSTMSLLNSSNITSQ